MRTGINYRKLAAVALVLAALTWLGLMRLSIDTDVVRLLPSGEPAIADALEVFTHHPIHDQLAIDVALDREAPDSLVDIGLFVEQELRASGLFAQVGNEAFAELLPELVGHVADNLPRLFTKEELDREVAPLLAPENIDRRLAELYRQLATMEGIGQAGLIAVDPLGLRELVLGKMALLAPGQDTSLYRGQLLSADRRHLLLSARPLSAGTDTGGARRIAGLLSEIGRKLEQRFAANGYRVTLTPVGAYRAALDNEQIIRHDVQLALLLATLGIGLLLLLAFPRPLIGLLALVPALAGTGAALFVYSLFHQSISIMVLGFGGAIISITVDHGITYLLFLDCPHETRGREAAREVYALGLMAVATSIGALLVLSGSGFPIFTQLGQFTALGILFSFLFVHLVLPQIFPTMVPGKDRRLPLHQLVDRLYRTGRPGALVAGLLVIGLGFFARPAFHVSLDSMNTVSEATLAADSRVREVWGDIGRRVILMHRAGDLAAIQEGNDRLLARLDQDIRQGELAGGFVPSMLFPGEKRAADNLAAWRRFWAGGRAEAVAAHLSSSGKERGFAPAAFSTFIAQLQPDPTVVFQPIPQRFFGLLGIVEDQAGAGLIQFVTVQPGGSYDGAAFMARYGGDHKVFDANLFTKKLAELLFSTFTTMLLIIAVSVALLLYLFNLNLGLTLITLLPPGFAYVCTLGTLKLLGRPLDIPALMLSVVILGMGVDYSIYCVRAHQRYRDPDHPSFRLVRVGVFMSASSTLIGFGVLALADHSLLKSIGITSLLGIGYALLGAFLLLPPLLKGYYAWQDRRAADRTAKPMPRAVAARYRTMEPYPRIFAWLKLRLDPMFSELPRMVAGQPEARTIIDIGCGYGAPACWCLEWYPEAEVFGIDPDPERVRVAALAIGGRGRVEVGHAPTLPEAGRPAELVLLLDMLHYLDDQTAVALLANCFAALGSGGLLVARVTLPTRRPSWSWRLEYHRIRWAGGRPWYRSGQRLAELLEQAGFALSVGAVAATNPELYWLVGRKAREVADGDPSV